MFCITVTPIMAGWLPTPLLIITLWGTMAYAAELKSSSRSNSLQIATPNAICVSLVGPGMGKNQTLACKVTNLSAAFSSVSVFLQKANRVTELPNSGFE